MSLFDKITRHIRHTGPMGIAEFMMLCLYDKDYGYYKSQKPIGAKGDFITAPEISQLFGEMIGIWVVYCFQNLDSPQTFRLVELGPGRGTLMKDVMRVLKVQNIAQFAHIELVEINPDLKAQQAQNLHEYSPIWFDNFEDLPDSDLPIFLIANEFLDCLPIRQFVKVKDKWHENLVGIDEVGLKFGLGPPLAGAPIGTNEIESDGTIFESAIGLENFVGKLRELLTPHGGHALFIDYGHFGEGRGDTFQALFKHQKQSPLENLGQSDLTAHVNFGALMDLAINNELLVQGPTTQAQILKSLGIETRADALIAQNPQKAQEIDQGLKRLIDQSAMGELFKAIIISKEMNS